MSRRRLHVVALAIAGVWLWAGATHADNCSGPSDCFGTAGSFNLASLGLLLGVGLSLLLDLMPIIGTAKGVLQAVTGRDAITGEPLSWWERALGLLPAAGKIVKAGVAIWAADRALDLARAAEAARDAARAASAAGDVARAADAARDAAHAADVARDAARVAESAAEASRAAQGADTVADAARAAEDAQAAARASAEAARAADAAADATRAADAARDAQTAAGTAGDVGEAARTAQAARQARLESLARDPARGNAVKPAGIAEAEVALGLEESGKVQSVTRDPSGAADFIDESGKAWDVKAPRSTVPGSSGRGMFELSTTMEKIERDIRAGEHVMIDTRHMTPEHVAQLQEAVAQSSFGDKVLFWP